MENLSVGEIVVLVIGLLLALAGAINTIGSAIEKIGKAVHAAKAPNDRQDERIAALEEWRVEIDGWRTAKDKEHRHIDDGNRVTQLALLALLDHGLDGNNIEQMQHAKEALQTHLINR